MSKERERNLADLKERPLESHKGNFGRGLLVGGSLGMAGAISLAGKAALRAGAGLITLAVPKCILPTVAGFDPCYMTVPLADEDGQVADAAPQLAELVGERTTAIGCGPGLGRGAGPRQLVRWLVGQATGPVVLDADALHLLPTNQAASERRSPWIVTPHPGEFRAMTGAETDDRLALEEMATEWARSNNAIVVLKGYSTYVTDGADGWHNETGNPGMATGGSGDVLTGIIVGFLCQGLSPLVAAKEAVRVHGMAGDIAASDLGQISLNASDLLDFVPDAIRLA